MKRNFDIEAAVDIASMAKSLMLLSGRGGSMADYNNRVFTCKTCNRQFSSFQALGGHCASHKKPRLTAGGDQQPLSSQPKPKTHECSICGLEFPIGQALGGHMRRHRSAAAHAIENNDNNHDKKTLPLLSLSPPIVKKSNSRRVLCLDLNLTPSENKFVFGKIDDAPAAVKCFF